MPSLAAGPRKLPFCALAPVGRVSMETSHESPHSARGGGGRALGTHALSSVQVRPERYVRSGTLVPPAAFAGRKMLNCASRPPSAADYVRARRWSRRGEVGVISAAAMGRWGPGHGEGESAGRTLNLYLKRVPSKTLLDESCSRDIFGELVSRRLVSS